MSAPVRTASAFSDGQWHRMHPLSPLLRGGIFLLAMIGIIVANLRERLIEWFLPWLVPGATGVRAPDDPVDYVLTHELVPIALLAMLGVALILVLLFWLSWRAHSFRITDDVEVRSGVLFRTHRRAPLDRVQGVNLTRPLVARLVGLSKLEVIGAGLDANVKLEYLATRAAEAVRSDILYLASGQRLAAAGAAPARGPLFQGAVDAFSDGVTGVIDGAEAPVTEPESVVHIPAGRLVASHLLSSATIWLIVLIVGFSIAASMGSPWLLIGFVPAVLGFGAYWVRSITRSLRYAIAPTPDGVRVTFGLFTTVTEILPPGRVHAVEVRQPLMWRGVGWWSVRVNRLSGGASRQNGQDVADVLPVGTLGDVERVLDLLLPGLDQDQRAAVFTHGLSGSSADEGDPYTTTPRRARLLRLLSWRRNGFVLKAQMLFFRHGFIWRRLNIFPLARMQSIAMTQGPLRRSLAVANITVHTIEGPVSGGLRVVGRAEALELFDATETHAIAARSLDRSHRWAAEQESS
ncbi:putative membrane protein [Microbacterium halimionae]|uniref:Putative membrane protein n=1 Tax=Microbacterium halimionae TaxID=1526413 RepID=A0A7W3JRL8_9MICO|nr:PH domain-containing protein [Microbacterium halimionae]MBA8817696.1 putative membrane protein [Microbacterium halimionae]NII94569.1 putative membrane protein [Microbacterium halimionae]